MKPKATVERTGRFDVVHTRCRDCDRPLVLPTVDHETGLRFEVNEFALKWADLLVCDDCYAVIEAERLAREQQREIEDRVKAAGIPPTFRGLSFDDMDSRGEREKPVAAAWAWSDAPNNVNAGLLLWGSPGTGKTRLAATAAWRRLQVRPVTWCSVAHVIAQLQTSFTDDDRKEAVRKLTGTGALVLDDLDKVKPTEWVVSQLFVAIDRRVAAGAALLVTTNEKPSRLVERFGQPLMSRLMGYCRVLELAGRDRRLGQSSGGLV